MEQIIIGFSESQIGDSHKKRGHELPDCVE